MIVIGIPAYNEEKNIGKLLKSLLSQNVVTKIIVYNDGSSDKTAQIVKRFRKVFLIDSRVRCGLAAGQNAIIKQFSGEYLVLVNADMIITDKNFIKKLIMPGHDLIAANLVPLKPKTFLGNVVWVGQEYKKRVFENLNDGDNWFTCHGGARAFSAKMLKNFRFEKSVGEDMYSYFYANAHNLKYRFAKDAIVNYKIPDNFADHRKQSPRFFKSKESYKKYFLWPKKKFLIEGLKLLLDYPIHASVYPFLTLVTFIDAKINGKFITDKWHVVTR